MGDILFYKYKINEIVNKTLLATDKFIPELDLRQRRFTCHASVPFTENKERIQKFKETGDLIYVYQNDLDGDCFQHDMVYRDFKDLHRRAASDEVLRDKAFNITEYLKHYGNEGGIPSMVYKLFGKKLRLILLHVPGQIP